MGEHEIEKKHNREEKEKKEQSEGNRNFTLVRHRLILEPLIIEF